MKALLDTMALSAALTAFEESLASGGERGPSADIYRQAEKRVYFAVDLAALTELGARARTIKKLTKPTDNSNSATHPGAL